MTICIWLQDDCNWVNRCIIWFSWLSLALFELINLETFDNRLQSPTNHIFATVGVFLMANYPVARQKVHNLSGNLGGRSKQ
jgi:hypothetical protein